MITITGPEELRTHLDSELGISDWITVDQPTINAFANATGDHQWIHIDPARAVESPFGSTIAHGLYTLSLGPGLCLDMFTFDGFSFGLNYGYQKVRFPAPLPVNSRVRMRAHLSGVEDIAGGLQVTVTQTFEVDGTDKPVCVAEAVSRLYV